jgi:hypothetical protein
MGVLGQSPFAGVTWQGLHFLEGFRRLGLDVFYVEDTGEWPYDPVANAITADPSYAISYLGTVLARCHLQSRWLYRSAAEDGQVYGPADMDLGELMKSADLLVNLTGATVLRPEHLQVPIRVYLETDPVLPELLLAVGDPFTTEQFESHTHIATFGERLGSADCGVPIGDHRYLPTRQPVVVDWWSGPRQDAAAPYSTIASWKQTAKDIVWEGETYTWSKHHEFLKLLDLPRRIPRQIRLALAAIDAADVELLRRSGWEVIDALAVSGQPDRYRQFIQGSFGEFTVAKDQNVRLRSGWFSDRSACYLASGRPVVTQETGFCDVLPTGEGLFGFSTADEAVAAIEAIEGDPVEHAEAAVRIARSHFEATTVLSELLRGVGLDW